MKMASALGKNGEFAVFLPGGTLSYRHKKIHVFCLFLVPDTELLHPLEAPG
jgi:hypothetical protein